MSGLEDATARLNEAADSANVVTTFFDDVTTLGETSTVTNLNNGLTVPSIQKQVKDLFDSLPAVSDDSVDALEAAAIAVGAKYEEVIATTDTTTVLDDVLYIYDASEQVTYAKPEIIADSETITSLSSGILTTSSSATYNLNITEDIDLSKSGLVFGDASFASQNTEVLKGLYANGRYSLDLKNDLYINALTYNDNSILVKYIKISSKNGSSLNVMTSGTVFTINSNGSGVLYDVDVNATGGVTELFTTVNNTDTRIKSISVKRSRLDGFIRFAVRANGNNLQDPDTFINGVETFTFQKNTVSNSDDIGIWLINAMYDKVIIKDNIYHNCKGCYVFDSINNTSTDVFGIRDNKKELIITGNKYENDIDFDATGATGYSSYVAFALTEGSYCEYSGNFVKNLHAWGASGSGVYDIYQGGNYINMFNNECINRFNFRDEAKTNYATNVGLKIKQTLNAEVRCNTYDYEEGYFEYHLSQGRDYNDFIGDFFSIEHFENGAAGRILIENNYIRSEVLSDSTRDGYFCSQMIVDDNTFKSNSTGYSTLIHAKLDPTVNADTSKILSVSRNKLLIPNADNLAMLYIQPSQDVQHNIDIIMTGNTGNLNNVTMFTSNSGGVNCSLESINISDNILYCAGDNVHIVSQYAVVPTVGVATTERNVITAPNCGNNTAPYGSGLSGAAQYSSSGTLITNGGYANVIKLDTIIGADNTQPINSPAGVYICKFTIYDLDDSSALGLGYTYDVEMSYKLEVSGGVTVATFLNSEEVSSSNNTGISSTTSVYTKTTAPNVSARFIATNNTMELGLNRGIGGTGQIVRIDSKVVKIPL